MLPQEAAALHRCPGNFRQEHALSWQAQHARSEADSTLQVNGSIIKLQTWDTAGQERFQALGPAYFRGAAGAIIVYDVTQQGGLSSVSVSASKEIASRAAGLHCEVNRCCMSSGRDNAQDGQQAQCFCLTSHTRDGHCCSRRDLLPTTQPGAQTCKCKGASVTTTIT